MNRLRFLISHFTVLRPAWVDVLVCGFLPGALLGAHLAGLLHFLNPDLPHSRGDLFRAVGIYAALLGAAALVLLLPILWRRADRARAFLPWGLTAAFALAALLDWIHASFFTYYLPPGIGRRMITAALLLSLAALIAFYTSLLHTLHRRRYGRRSRLGFIFLCLASIYVMVERREAFQPREARARPTAVRSEAERPRLFVIALDAASLDAILPLAEQGRLPFFSSLLRDGAYGRLASLAPYRRVPLWTSLATGQLPFKHGIVADRVYPAPHLGRTARLKLLPQGLAFSRWGALGRSPVAIGRGDRRALSLWQILSRLGVSSGVIGWPAISPVPTGLEFAIDERFFSSEADPATASPPDLAERGRLFEVPPEELDPLLLERFGAEVPVPGELLPPLAGDVWRESLLTFVTGQRPAAATFLALPGLGAVSRSYFGGYSAVQFDGATGDRQTAAAEVVAGYYGHLDSFLSELSQLEAGPMLFAVVSPAGVRDLSSWHRAGRALLRRDPSPGTFADSPDGVFFFRGPGLRAGQRLDDISLLDVAPTLLYALGHPIARNLDGRVLTEAFEPSFLAAHPLTVVPSYEVQPVMRSAPRPAEPEEPPLEAEAEDESVP